jgi:hypothetical protein
MNIVNSKQTNLVYQKQLLTTLGKIVSFRTDLIKQTALLALDGKEKEWHSVYSQIKFVKKQIEKNEDHNLKTISKILSELEEPIAELERQLELKNNFLQVLEVESFKNGESVVSE